MHSFSDRYLKIVIMLIGSAFLFYGCANLSGQSIPESDDDMDSTTSEQADSDTAEGGNQKAEASYRFIDVPVPSKFKLDRTKSFIYEAGSFKAGIITYTGWTKIDGLADFYKKNMPAHQWEMVSIFEHSDVTLVYSKEGWSCSVNISSSNLGGSRIRIHIGPVNAP